LLLLLLLLRVHGWTTLRVLMVTHMILIVM
jgi:hypothetical protein